MSPNRRNAIVGATVLAGLILLGWMLLKFGATPAKWFSEPSIPITIITERADGISEGSQVYYRGVSVGRVKSVSLLDNLTEVQIEAEVDVDQQLPANVQGKIGTANLLGGSARLALELTNGKPEGKLQKGQKLTAKFVGMDVLPPEYGELANDLRLTSQQFRESKLIDNLNAAVISAQKTIESTQQLIGDEKMRQDLKDSFANIKTATDTAVRVADKMDKFGDNLQTLSTQASDTIVKAQGAVDSAKTTIDKTRANIDDLSRQLSDRIGQVGKLLETFNSISKKIDEGHGTVGKLVNDPKLYESLVDTSKELNATISDLKRLVEQWEQEGMSFKLK
jgi:phospholipid/cholesterol/gamma-HCH transport system substrate-binding protein